MFVPGRPPVPCRPYSRTELAALEEAVLAVVDADMMRGFHGQYAALAADASRPCYEDAVPW